MIFKILIIQIVVGLTLGYVFDKILKGVKDE